MAHVRPLSFGYKGTLSRMTRHFGRFIVFRHIVIGEMPSATSLTASAPRNCIKSTWGMIFPFCINAGRSQPDPVPGNGQIDPCSLSWSVGALRGQVVEIDYARLLCVQIMGGRRPLVVLAGS